MQIGKEPLYHNQLNFNLDFSSPGSSAYGSGSPQVIMIQKLPQEFKPSAYQPANFPPKSNKLNLAIKIAKLDVSNHMRESQHQVKKSPLKKSERTKKKPLHGSKANDQMQNRKNTAYSYAQFKPRFPISFGQNAKKANRSNVSRTPYKLNNLKPYSDLAIEQSKMLFPAHRVPVKDVGTSTDDKTVQFIKQDAAYSPIIKAKLNNSLKQSTPITHTGLPFYQTPPQNLSTRSPNPVKQQVLIKKNDINRSAVKKSNGFSKTKDHTLNDPPPKTSHAIYDSKEERLSKKKDILKDESNNGITESEACPALEEELNSMCKSLYQRLLDMEDTERGIRSRWMEIKYDVLREPTEKFVCQQQCVAPEKPEAIDIVGGRTTPSKVNKEAVKFVCEKRNDSPGIQFTNIKSSKCPHQKRQKLLLLPLNTIESVYQNKSKYSDYLHRTFHEPKGKFDPWSIVNELSEDIVQKIVNDVCDEVNEDFDGCIEQLFESEFANPDNSRHYSFM